MSKPRKKYKPKGVRMDALTWVISGFKKVADVPDAGTKLLLKNHISFDEIREAQDAIYQMAQRGVSGKPFLFTGLELQAVELVISLHDEQLKHCPVRTLELALEDIEKEFKGNKMRKIEALTA